MILIMRIFFPGSSDVPAAVKECMEMLPRLIFNFSIPVVREDEELASIGGISLENSTLSNVELPLEKLSTHERVVFLCERDHNLQFVNINNPRIHGHYSPV